MHQAGVAIITEGEKGDTLYLLQVTDRPGLFVCVCESVHAVLFVLHLLWPHNH